MRRDTNSILISTTVCLQVVFYVWNPLSARYCSSNKKTRGPSKVTHAFHDLFGFVFQCIPHQFIEASILWHGVGQGEGRSSCFVAMVEVGIQVTSVEASVTVIHIDRLVSFKFFPSRSCCMHIRRFPSAIVKQLEKENNKNKNNKKRPLSFI